MWQTGNIFFLPYGPGPFVSRRIFSGSLWGSSGRSSSPPAVFPFLRPRQPPAVFPSCLWFCLCLSISKKLLARLSGFRFSARMSCTVIIVSKLSACPTRQNRRRPAVSCFGNLARGAQPPVASPDSRETRQRTPCRFPPLPLIKARSVSRVLVRCGDGKPEPAAR